MNHIFKNSLIQAENISGLRNNFNYTCIWYLMHVHLIIYSFAQCNCMCYLFMSQDATFINISKSDCKQMLVAKHKKYAS